MELEMEGKYLVEYDYEYIPVNCDNIHYFDTETEARSFIKRHRDFCPDFVARLWEYDGVAWKVI